MLLNAMQGFYLPIKKNSLLFSCWILFRIKKKWYESISSISDFHLVEVIERVIHRLEQTCVLFV